MCSGDGNGGEGECLLSSCDELSVCGDGENSGDGGESEGMVMI